MDDIQSWSEVPSIAHFCSLFRAAFNLLDFDIEELEEALLTDGTEDAGSSLLQELIVRLLCGCIQNSEISTFNYQMFLRRLFRQKCHEYGRENPFNTDIDFQFLPLRTKVEILHALCDFRLDAEDVQDLLKNLESDSLRVEPLGHDENKSAYWYFYGTRLYREDFPKTRKKIKEKRRKSKEDKRKKKKSKTCYESDIEEDMLSGPGVWQVVCYTEEDWQKLAAKLKGSSCKEERSLHRTLTEDFLPEIPRLFAEKERLQRKRMMEYQPRRQSTRLEKLKQKEEQEKVLAREEEDKLRLEREERERRERLMARAVRAINRGSSRSGSECGSYRSESRARSEAEDEEAAATATRRQDKSLDNDQLTSVGRQTNNSLSSATGQIIIQPPRKKKLRSKQVFKTTTEDLRTGMYKILDLLKNHEEAWPFVDAVDENYAPRYYSVIRKPMDLQTMEDKLDAREYITLGEFRADFQLIVDNCRQYNGWENEYTEMVKNLQDAFEEATDRYFESDPSSDEEVAVEFASGREGQDQETTHLGDHRGRTRRRRREKERERERANKENTRVKESASDESDGSSSKPPCLKPQRVRSPLSDRSGSVPGSDFDDKEPDFLREHSPPQLVKAVEEGDSKDSADDSSVDSKMGSLGRRDRRDAMGRPRRGTGIMKNVAAIEALSLATEQTLKDINKWLDDTPRFSEFSSASNSPCPPEEVGDRPKKKELQTKRRRHHDLHKQQPRRKEVQRTIERLQPGKSKGNLITNLPKAKEVEESGITIGLGLGKLVKESRNALLVKTDETAPKLSLGTVLKSDIISFGKSKHSFDEKDKTKKDTASDDHSEGEGKPELPPVVVGETKVVVLEQAAKRSPDTKSDMKKEEFSRDKENEHTEKTTKEEEKRVCDEEKKRVAVKEITNKNKPTPNLSAWFKAFGAPKAPSNAKRKTDLNEPPPTPGRGLTEAFKSDKPEIKESDKTWQATEAPPSVELEEPPPSVSVPSVASVASPMPSPDIRPDVTLSTLAPAPRQRKASTSSSLSERSSFSQDPTDGSSPHLTMDERLGAPYPSPLHPSPYPSPKGEDLAQKSAYASINGTIRVGFYQDTSSNLQKSSPEKQSPNSNSPRDQRDQSEQSEQGDQGNSSPFQSYSHVYPPTVSQVSHPPPTYPSFTSTPSTTNLYEGLSQYTLPTMMSYADPSYRSVPKSQDNFGFPPRHAYPNPEPTPKPPSSVFPVKKRLYAEMEAGRLQIPSEPPCRPSQQLQSDSSGNMSVYTDPSDSLGFCRLQQPASSDLPQYDRYGQQRMHHSMPSAHHAGYQDVTDVSDLSKQGEPMETKEADLSRLQVMSSMANMQNMSNMPTMSTMSNMPTVSTMANMPNMSMPNMSMPSMSAMTNMPAVSTMSNMAPMASDYSKMQGPDMSGQGVDKARGLGSLMDNLGRLQQGTRGPYGAFNTITEDNDGVFRSKDPVAGSRRPNMSYQGVDNMEPSMLRPSLSNLSHIVDRYQTESLYTDKGLTNMFGKNVPNYSQSVGLGKTTGSMQQGYNTELNIPKPPGLMETSKPSKSRKKQAAMKTSETPGTTAFQQYVSGLKPSEPSAISLKTSSVVPGSAFNFGPAPTGLGLPNPLYSDSGLLDELRQQQGSYYSMVAAAAHHGTHRSTPDTSTHGTAYPPFMNPHQAHQAHQATYQQYIHRFQEEQLQLRHSGVPVLHQGLYPAGYHPALGIPRQSYDRPSWL